MQEINLCTRCKRNIWDKRLREKENLQYFMLDYKVWCSIYCYENKNKERRSNSKVQNRPQANKSNKGQTKIYKKSRKQKKR